MQLHLFEASFKRCVGCRHTKPLDAFNRRSSAPDGRQAYCRECNARWHAENRERHNQSIHRRNQQVRGAMRRQMVEYLSDKQCVDCRETDLRVLEFDHLRDKTTTVSQLNGERELAARPRGDREVRGRLRELSSQTHP